MGNNNSRMDSSSSSSKNKKKKVLRQQCYQLNTRRKKELQPYILAIENPEVLDWKKHIVVQEAERRDVIIAERMKSHEQLPIQITASGGLFISNSMGVSNTDKLKELGITHVLNVGGNEAAWLPPEAYNKKNIQYKIIQAYDEPTYPMLDMHWDECCEYISNAIGKTSKEEEEDNEVGKGGKCVVHCQAGLNRSALIVAAYYMVSYQKNVLETILHCRMCRGNRLLSTNPGFQCQLVALARKEGLLGPKPGQDGCIVKM